MVLHLETAPILLFAFIIGTCVGSFLNVVIARVPRRASIVYPGSHCPKCKDSIPFYLNIPVISYILLKGRCRSCGLPISLRYPLVEMLTGLLAVGTVLKFGPGLSGLYIFIFGATLIAVSFIDLDHQIIPDSISLPGILIFLSSPFFLPEATFVSSFTGVLVGGGILYSVALGYYLLKGQHGMGGGDIKLLAMVGAVTGPKGVLFTLFTASVLGTLAGVVILLKNRFKNRPVDGRMKLPFGPFLSMGALIYLFWGELLMRWYIGFIAVG